MILPNMLGRIVQRRGVLASAARLKALIGPVTSWTTYKSGGGTAATSTVDLENRAVSYKGDGDTRFRIGAIVPIVNLTPGGLYLVTFDVAGTATDRSIGSASQGSDLASASAAPIATGNTVTFTATGDLAYITFDKRTISTPLTTVSNIRIEEL